MKFPHRIILCLVAYCDAAFPFETHCGNEKKIIFNCHVEKSKKVVSVCMSKPGQDGQYLQYEFGEPGKSELVFPKQGRIKKGQFSYDRQYSDIAGWLQYDLTFTIGRNKYNVYWMESGKTDGIPKEKVEKWGGVHVATGGGKSIDFRCNENVVHDFDSAYGFNVRAVDQK